VTGALLAQGSRTHSGYLPSAPPRRPPRRGSLRGVVVPWHLRRQLRRIRRQREHLLAPYLDDKLPKDELYADRERDLQCQEASLAERVTQAEAATSAADAQAQQQDAVLRYCRLIRRGLDRLDNVGRQRLLRLRGALAAGNGTQCIFVGVLTSSSLEGRYDCLTAARFEDQGTFQMAR